MERLDIKLPSREKELLNTYCLQIGRKKTDVLRELIRGLKDQIISDEFDKKDETIQQS